MNGVKFNYKEVKYYIEVESGSGCKLLSTEYDGIKKDLEIKCICGNIFLKSFDAFKNQRQQACKECNGKTDWDIYKVKEYLKDTKFQLLDDIYINIDTKMTLRCDKGYLYNLSLYQLKNKKSFHFVNKFNPYTIHNIKLWCKLNNKLFELISDMYSGTKNKLKFICLKEDCKEIFEANWSEISNGNGCPFCAGKQVGLSNCLATRNPKLAFEWHPILNGDLSPFNVTHSSNQFAWWKCKECRHEWKAKISNRNHNRGCPECNESHGEKRIKEVLNLYNYYFDSQYTFNDLKGLKGGLLKFDSALFWNEDKTNLRMLIEYDGIFHYEKQYDEDGFEKLKMHDKLKDEYCEKNNIKLLRIPYWDYDNIEDVLLKELKKVTN